MLPIIKEIKQKLRTARGFTMVELMVVLLILGILAALAGTGLIAYVRLARFEHNESGARTVFQTAQIALTRKDTSGDMDTFLTELREVGTLGDHFSADGLSEQFGDGAAEKANAFNSQIYALYYDKANPDSDASKMVRGLFAMRRKTIANNLKASFGIKGEDAARILSAAGVEGSRRAETLSPAEFGRLANAAFGGDGAENA